MISLVIYGSRDAFPSLPEIDRHFRDWHSPPERSRESWESEYEWWHDEVSEVICGVAPGADAVGAVWAEKRGFPVVKMPADWSRHGKIAGYVRNKQMAERATHGLGFWRNWSRGTAQMTTCLVSLGKPVKVVEWSPEKTR